MRSSRGRQSDRTENLVERRRLEAGLFVGLRDLVAQQFIVRREAKSMLLRADQIFFSDYDAFGFKLTNDSAKYFRRHMQETSLAKSLARQSARQRLAFVMAFHLGCGFIAQRAKVV